MPGVKKIYFFSLKCDCHTDDLVLLEVKAPYRLRDGASFKTLDYVNIAEGECSLNKNSEYYAQVQVCISLFFLGL